MPRARPSRIAPPSPLRRLAAETEPADGHDAEELSADVLADEAQDLTNGDLARALHEIGDILEVQGEIAFKTIAYHRAADAIGRSPIDLVAAYRAGTAPKIAGIGAAISDKITEYVTTGRMAYLDRLRSEIPASLVELLQLPGLGPKTVRQLHIELGIEDMAGLKAAARDGRVRTVRGLSEKTEKLVLEGIERLENEPPRRLYLHQAEEHIDALTTFLATVPGVTSIEPAGSYRRKKETIGDLDLLAETTDPAALMAAFTQLGGRPDVVARGAHKSAIRLHRGPQVDLMVMPPGSAGAYRIHFTGSKEHNVRLRAMARDLGWSLSEYGFQRIGEDGELLTGADAELRTFATEAEAYAFLGLPFIEPELREDEGEIEAAKAGTLPALITKADLRGDCHTHSEWSDGGFPIEVMAETARRRGYAYQVLTDHSQSLAIANGLTPDRVEEERAIIAALNERFAAEEAAGTAPAETPKEGFRLLHGCELEVRADGELDYEDDLLARFDVVVASVHVARRQPRAELTRRTLNAIRSPHVDIVAHPAGRMIQTRDDLDLDWEAVYEAAARTGTALEMNGSPHRLDLSPERARRAVAAGCILAIDSDAHHIRELDDTRWGVAQARRAWVTAADVLNTRSRADLLAWVAAKPSRIAG
ncbi:MAG TPA: DNA polymerase/3'-5' exonuclease PolX [Candidatus Limnocylindrales bacterium]|nr:DNA polymerase/3'-5' exonuclease PolX [Candidatus Limnocylindrales bacterium]